MKKIKFKKTIFFIISGPSGAGEDSVIEGLSEKIEFQRVVTTITRSKRKGESERKPYCFTTVPEFKKMIEKDEFIEWAKVYGDYRGATKKEMNDLVKKKALVLWKVDFQGVKTAKKKIPGILSILILPPSLEDLKNRLIKRNLDTSETIKKRESFTKKWLKQKKYYDYVVVNEEGKLDECIEKVYNILLESLEKSKAIDFLA